ncbi:hypothetical protein CALCODRAFT_119971 [Calocera cornea HHB12733]|uniref:Uncharacterized protein n=1 Tax=Calocera cornea HHB12733 TaxID=1353952 RepID=A0A165IEN1_9BASI|nr:hypothetical protein CALCODRAFT_119971 [Calocera cornea HHB12733]
MGGLGVGECLSFGSEREGRCSLLDVGRDAGSGDAQVLLAVLEAPQLSTRGPTANRENAQKPTQKRCAVKRLLGCRGTTKNEERRTITRRRPPWTSGCAAMRGHHRYFRRTQQPRTTERSDLCSFHRTSAGLGREQKHAATCDHKQVDAKRLPFALPDDRWAAPETEGRLPKVQTRPGRSAAPPSLYWAAVAIVGEARHGTAGEGWTAFVSSCADRSFWGWTRTTVGERREPP